MRLPQSTKSRVWLAVAGLGVLVVIAFGITAFNLWQDGNGPSASGSKDGKSGIPAGPSDYPAFEGPSASPSSGAAGAFGGALFGKGKSGSDPFASSSGGDTRLHTVTVSIKADGAAYVGYRYRDGRSSNAKVVGRAYSFTRTVRGPLPVAQIGVQVMSTSTYATCSIAIDGTTTVVQTAHGRNNIVVCLS